MRKNRKKIYAAKLIIVLFFRSLIDEGGDFHH